jgi:Domain of unknown function (DUF5753)
MQMERQRRAAASVPEVWAVLDEAAVRRQVGGRHVMRKQIEHLIGLSATPHFFLQLVPYTTGAYPAPDLPFVILGFPDPPTLMSSASGTRPAPCGSRTWPTSAATTCSFTIFRRRRCRPLTQQP